MYYLVYFTIISLVVLTDGQYEGDKCTTNNIEGVCTNFEDCKSGKDYIQNNRPAPELCSFSSTGPIVCCLNNAGPTTYQPPVATTSRPTTTTEYVPPVNDYVWENKDSVAEDGCEPIPSNMTATKTGQKAWDKCIEYQHKLILPCERGVSLIGTKARGNYCNHKGTQLIVGGKDALNAEFPHMVLLGLEKYKEVSWVCGGTLLSERFVLTAGHCTYNRFRGKVKYARTGVLKRDDAIDPSRYYKIIKVIKHPKYKHNSKYNDIALLKTDRDVYLDQFTVPACLDVGSPNNYERAQATGWGATRQRGAVAQNLQKVTVNKFSGRECFEIIIPGRQLINGINESTQICYGDKKESKDSCQGDSGGPLQLYHQQIHCMYTVIGVASFGDTCGYIGEPGVYTRVSAFVPWIESIVWP